MRSKCSFSASGINPEFLIGSKCVFSPSFFTYAISLLHPPGLQQSDFVSFNSSLLIGPQFVGHGLMMTHPAILSLRVGCSIQHPKEGDRLFTTVSLALWLPAVMACERSVTQISVVPAPICSLIRSKDFSSSTLNSPDPLCPPASCPVFLNLIRGRLKGGKRPVGPTSEFVSFCCPPYSHYSI